MGCCFSGPAIISAADCGNVDKLREVLSRGDDVNTVDSDNGDTATIRAAYRGHAECLRMLLDKGANVNMVSHNGNTATILAAGRGHAEWLRYLRPIVVTQSACACC